MQILSVAGVELADRVVGVAEKITARSIHVLTHIYYHG